MISTSSISSNIDILNPITSIRTSVDLSIREFARILSVGPQTLYLTECGCYTQIPPKIITRIYEEDFIFSEYPSVETVEVAYTFFRECKQRGFGATYGFYSLPDRQADRQGIVPVEGNYYEYELPDWDGLSSPVESFYTSLDLSRSGFAKSLAIQPSSLVRLNNKSLNHIPGQILKALTTAGLPINLLTELQDRHESYVRL